MDWNRQVQQKYNTTPPLRPKPKQVAQIAKKWVQSRLVPYQSRAWCSFHFFAPRYGRIPVGLRARTLITRSDEAILRHDG
jgi:hypothetical protein